MGKKEARSNKWTFIAYEESAPKNLKLALEALKVPFALSPLHDKDVNMETGEFKKPHWHGVLYFDSLKSYSQVSELVSEKLNAPSHVEVVMSSKGLYDYFIHAENPEKTLYSKDDIQSGCGFDLDKFLSEQDDSQLWNEAIDVVEQNNFTEFEELVTYARKNKSILQKLIVNKTYFFAKLLDSRRYKQDEMTRKCQVRKKDDDDV